MSAKSGEAHVEVAAEARGKVELRYDPADLDKLPLVYVDGRHVCDTVALDLHRNNGRRRRKIEPPPELPLEPTGIDVLADIERDYYERVRIDATPEQERD